MGWRKIESKRGSICGMVLKRRWTGFRINREKKYNGATDYLRFTWKFPIKMVCVCISVFLTLFREIVFLKKKSAALASTSLPDCSFGWYFDTACFINI